MFKPFDLAGKVGLVTGGNGGIGLGMAEGIAQAGAAVEIWGTNAEKNARAKDKIAAHGGRVSARIVDVSREEDVAAAMQALVAEHGRLDACFANAGVANRWKSFLDIGGENYRRVMAINVDGMLWTMREACRHMQARAEAGDPGGSVVAVSSMIVGQGGPRNEDYAASKAAVLGFVEGVAVEFARFGIRANAILPGWIETEMTGALHTNEKFLETVLSRVPQRRWGKPEDFAGIAVYLASDASAFHTGDKILIDGGYTRY
jgi:NAD(P)-dependent dehydrogenase (short-subunit alcohol dehydrogenase family)